MAEWSRFRDIPVRRAQIVDGLLAELDEKGSPPDSLLSASFTRLAGLLETIYHLKFHAWLEVMKGYYAPFNPDDALQQRTCAPRKESLSPAEIQKSATDLATWLRAVLERGNYQELTDEDIQHAFESRSLFPLQVEVDRWVYDACVIYARGESVQHAQVPRWYGLRKKDIDVPTFDRVCLYLRFKAKDNLGHLSRRGQRHLNFTPGATILKLFRNIPKADLEMLFPNCRVRMRLFDKLLLGVPALVGGIPVIAKLIPAVLALAIILGMTQGEIDRTSIITGLTGLAVLGTYMFRQWNKFKNRRVLFLKVLSENLYFRNLDNNDGVLTRLVDEAEEEESKEALLGYALLRKSEAGLHPEALDDLVEDWLATRFGVKVDFEVKDALDKLKTLGLIYRDEGGRYHARPHPEAIGALESCVTEQLAPFDGMPPSRRE